MAPFIVADHARRGLPARVGVGVWRGGQAEPSTLFASEAALLGPRATDGRRRTFAMGRAAARLALAELGVAPGPIGRGSNGEPIWPPGLVGSISHSADMAMALVGWRRDYAGLGVDYEQLSPGVSERAVRLVSTPAEQAWLACAPAVYRTMLFSAKEAIFKALNPIEGVWLGFADAELTWDDEARLFVARLRKTAAAGYPSGAVLRVWSTLAEGEVLSTTYAAA